MLEKLSKTEYCKSLLYLTHGVIRSDGLVHIEESMALNNLCQNEKISFEERDKFLAEIEGTDSNHIFLTGLDALKKCSFEEQGKVLGWIYRLVEADNSIDVREARFLLYAINASQYTIEDIIEISKSLPKI